jgi:predicted cation transporter
MTVILTFLAIFAVLLGPILVKPIERNVEFFFLIVGTIIPIVMGQSSFALMRSALTQPIALTSVILVFGIVFGLLQLYLDRLLSEAISIFGQRWLCFGLTIILGLLAGFITAVVAALVLAEAISLLRLDRTTEIAATVFGCFAIGLGGGMTPLGMPASTLVLAALHADFWYLARLFGPFVIAGILLVAIPTLFLAVGQRAPAPLIAETNSWAPVLIRAGKVYIFIVGLVGLSAGLRPVVDAYVSRLPSALLFWLNTLSAVLDNATLAAVEIGPALSLNQQRSALLSLLISGGMLIPGNIPNIVAASRLGINGREWARIGIGTGALLLILCFAVLSAIAFFQ